MTIKVIDGRKGGGRRGRNHLIREKYKKEEEIKVRDMTRDGIKGEKLSETASFNTHTMPLVATLISLLVVAVFKFQIFLEKNVSLTLKERLSFFGIFFS